MNAKDKKSSNFLDRYLQIRENNEISNMSQSPNNSRKVFKKSQRQLMMMQKHSKELGNQISIVDNSVKTASPREIRTSNQQSSYKYLMSFKNAKSNEQL